MTDDVLEEWYRLAERIAHVPMYEFGEPFTQWEARGKRAHSLVHNQLGRWQTRAKKFPKSNPVEFYKIKG